MFRKLILVAIIITLGTYYSVAQPNKVKGGFTICISYIYKYQNGIVDNKRSRIESKAQYDDNGTIIEKVAFGLNGSIITYKYDFLGNVTEKTIDRPANSNEQSQGDLYTSPAAQRQYEIAKELERQGRAEGNIEYGGGYTNELGVYNTIPTRVSSAPKSKMKSNFDEENQNPENQTFYRETYKNDNYGNQTEKNGYDQNNKIVQRTAYYFSK